MKTKITIVFGNSDFTFVADSVKVIIDLGLPIEALPKQYVVQSDKLLKSEFTKGFCPIFVAMLATTADCTIKIQSA